MRIKGHSRLSSSSTVDAALGITVGLYSQPEAETNSLGRNKPADNGLNDMAGSHFCPLFSFGLGNCLQKPIVGFPPLQVDRDDRTKCNLLALPNETQVLRRVSRLYQLVLNLERQGQYPSLACSFSQALLDHMEECPPFWRKLRL